MLKTRSLWHSPNTWSPCLQEVSTATRYCVGELRILAKVRARTNNGKVQVFLSRLATDMRHGEKRLKVVLFNHHTLLALSNLVCFAPIPYPPRSWSTQSKRCSSRRMRMKWAAATTATLIRPRRPSEWKSSLLQLQSRSSTRSRRDRQLNKLQWSGVAPTWDSANCYLKKVLTRSSLSWQVVWFFYDCCCILFYGSFCALACRHEPMASVRFASRVDEHAKITERIAWRCKKEIQCAAFWSSCEGLTEYVNYVRVVIAINITVKIQFMPLVHRTKMGRKM